MNFLDFDYEKNQIENKNTFLFKNENIFDMLNEIIIENSDYEDS
jgi:hypothetical protein